jgi:hypothetical protein
MFEALLTLSGELLPAVNNGRALVLCEATSWRTYEVETSLRVIQ